MSTTLFDLIRSAEVALRKGDTDQPRLLVGRARRAAGRSGPDVGGVDAELTRYRTLMQRTVEVTLARGLEPVAESMLDGVMEVVGARRGFVGLVEGDDWRVVLARGPEGEAVSRSIVGTALQTGEPVVTHDAAGAEYAEQASVHAMQLRSVVCLPLRTHDRTIGFVYLDNAEAQALFDDAAVATVQGWMPLFAAALARAADDDAGSEGDVLPGVLTRSSRMRAELGELARIATFDVPVMLAGETGTGKSLVARQLHHASARAAQPFVHVNCGAIPESLIEAELFGAEAGAFTGAKARRIGRFEDADGGTLFLDELDSMPLACQVRLLVALQEGHITRLGSNDPVSVDVRVIAAMGRDPFEAIDAGDLREDLYYRIAVFVARLPALRERREDIALLATHFLEQTRKRYRLPPLRLSEAALDALTAHDWPGNVRELGNTLDRAALLARDGEITRVDFQGRRGATATSDAGAGAVGPLVMTARRLAAAMEDGKADASLDIANALRGALLLELVRRHGSREAAYKAIGQEALVRNRNHNRAFQRETRALDGLLASLGESLPAELTEALG